MTIVSSCKNEILFLLPKSGVLPDVKALFEQCDKAGKSLNVAEISAKVKALASKLGFVDSGSGAFHPFITEKKIYRIQKALTHLPYYLLPTLRPLSCYALENQLIEQRIAASADYEALLLRMTKSASIFTKHPKDASYFPLAHPASAHLAYRLIDAPLDVLIPYAEWIYGIKIELSSLAENARMLNITTLIHQGGDPLWISFKRIYREIYLYGERESIAILPTAELALALACQDKTAEEGIAMVKKLAGLSGEAILPVSAVGIAAILYMHGGNDALFPVDDKERLAFCDTLWSLAESLFSSQTFYTLYPSDREFYALFQKLISHFWLRDVSSWNETRIELETGIKKSPSRFVFADLLESPITAPAEREAYREILANAYKTRSQKSLEKSRKYVADMFEEIEAVGFKGTIFLLRMLALFLNGGKDLKPNYAIRPLVERSIESRWNDLSEEFTFVLKTYPRLLPEVFTEKQAAVFWQFIPCMGRDWTYSFFDCFKSYFIENGDEITPEGFLEHFKRNRGVAFDLFEEHVRSTIHLLFEKHPNVCKNFCKFLLDLSTKTSALSTKTSILTTQKIKECDALPRPPAEPLGEDCTPVKVDTCCTVM